MVKITWLGHACFLIELSNGYKIVIDPHDGRSIGLPKPSVKADLVLVTHDHFDHNAIDIVRKEDTRVIKSLRGEAHVDDILIKGIRTYHDKEGGRRRGENTIYIIDVEGYKIAHLGDLGHKPMEQLDLLKDVDVLMTPIGGVYTIGPDEVWDLIDKIKPPITIPMHYWVRGLTLPLFTIDDFLAYVKKIKVTRIESNKFTLEDIIDRNIPQIIVLKSPTGK